MAVLHSATAIPWGVGSVECEAADPPSRAQGPDPGERGCSRLARTSMPLPPILQDLMGFSRGVRDARQPAADRRPRALERGGGLVGRPLSAALFHARWGGPAQRRRASWAARGPEVQTQPGVLNSS